MQDNNLVYVLSVKDQASGQFVKVSRSARQAANEIQAALNGTSASSTKVAGAINKLGSEQNKTAQSTRQAAGATREASKAQESYFLHIAKTTVQSALVNKAFLVMIDSIGAAAQRADLLMNFPATMEALGQSADDAKISIGALTDYIGKVGGDLNVAANSVTRFSEVTGNVKLAAKEFQGVNNALIAGGAGSEVQKNALEQLTQAYSRGVPQLIEWKSLMVAMPAQLNQVAKAMDFKNAQQLGEALTGGLSGMPEEVGAALKAVVKKMKLTGFGELGRKLAEGFVPPPETAGAIDAAVKAMGLSSTKELGATLSGVKVDMQDFLDVLTKLSTGSGPIVSQTEAHMRGFGYTFNVVKNQVVQALTDLLINLQPIILLLAHNLGSTIVFFANTIKYLVGAIKTVIAPTTDASFLMQLLGRVIEVATFAWISYRGALIGVAVAQGALKIGAFIGAFAEIIAATGGVINALRSIRASLVGVGVASAIATGGLSAIGAVLGALALGTAAVIGLNKLDDALAKTGSQANSSVGDIGGLGDVGGVTADAATDLSGALDGVANSARDVGGAVTQATKSLAPFDKMNVLDKGSSGGGGAFGGMAKGLEKVKTAALDARDALDSVNQAANESAQILQPTFNPQITWNPMPATFNPQKTIEAGAIQGSHEWASAFMGTLVVSQPLITQALGNVISYAQLTNMPQTISQGNSTGNLFISGVGNAVNSGQSLSVVSSAIKGTIGGSTAATIQNTNSLGTTTGNTYGTGTAVGIQNNTIPIGSTINSTITAATNNSMPLTVDNGQRIGETLAQSTVQHYTDKSGALWPTAGQASTADIFRMLNMVVPTAALMGDNVGQVFINAINQNTTKGVSNFDRALNTMYYLAKTGDWAGAFAVMGQALAIAMNDAIGNAMKGIKEMWNVIARAANRGIMININPAKWGPIDLPGVNVKATIGMPLLARGGIVNGPTAAMIGESGAEAVLPLENNTGWISMLADKINNLNGGANNQPVQLTVQIGEEKIITKVIDLINEKTQMSGRNTILV